MLVEQIWTANAYRNFNYLIVCEESGEALAIDPLDHEKCLAIAKARGWTITQVLNTHEHFDHTGGNAQVIAATGAKLLAHANAKDSIEGIDRGLSAGDVIKVGRTVELEALDTPGHTLGHISYYIPAAKAAFVADTLFSLGCGRVIEGTMPMMWGSLEKLLALPDDTTVYVGHEYTQANARFALTIDPSNPDLVARSGEVDALRAGNKSTLPTTIGLEKRTNPFLRVDSPAVRERLGMPAASAADVFGEIRTRKDNF